MKHRKKSRQFGRVRAQRTALERTMLGSLIMHERIETTEAKAKELSGVMDRMITRIKRTDAPMEQMRKLEGAMPKAAAQKLISTLLGRFAGRTSGYTRVIKLSPRTSDGARRALIEFVDKAQEEVAAEPVKETKEA